MARTQGHGNPDWTRDETILALDLYFDLEGKIPSGTDERIKKLSTLLRQFPYHAEASRKDSFRNPDGVAFKLQNLRQVATGKGLGNVSETDRRVWHELGKFPDKTKELACLIRAGLAESESTKLTIEEFEFAEGRLITELHLRRERDSRLRKRLIASKKKTSGLICEMCGALPLSTNPLLLDAQFEAHHAISLSKAGERNTRLSDMVLLCANCHRLLHRAIAVEKRWLSVDEGRDLCLMQGN